MVAPTTEIKVGDILRCTQRRHARVYRVDKLMTTRARIVPYRSRGGSKGNHREGAHVSLVSLYAHFELI